MEVSPTSIFSASEIETELKRKMSFSSKYDNTKSVKGILILKKYIRTYTTKIIYVIWAAFVCRKTNEEKCANHILL
jgi:hypothetical protein